MLRHISILLAMLMGCGGENQVGETQVSDINSDIPQMEYDVTTWSEITPDIEELPLPAPLTVGFATYKGVYPGLDKGEVRLLKKSPDGSPSCKGLSLRDATKMEATLSSSYFGITKTFTFEHLPGLQKDGTQNYMLLGFAYKGEKPAMAWACSETEVEFGKHTQVDLVLDDIPPSIAGTYEATLTIALGSGLPQKAADVMQGIAMYIEDPGGETLRIACLAAGPSGMLADFCKVLFSIPGDQSSLTGVGQTIMGIVRKNVPQGPTSEDVLKALVARLSGTITVSPELDDTGYCSTPACNEKWTIMHGQAPSGPVVNIPVSGLDGAPELERQGLSKLVIRKHPLSISYGQIVDQLVEKVILPARFGSGTPEVISFEAAFSAALGKKTCLEDGSCCTTFATMANKAEPGYPESFFYNACLALVSEGPAWLRGQLSGLGSSMHFGSIEPCVVSDLNDDMVVDAFGSEEKPCKIEVDFDLGSESFVTMASYLASRI